MEPSKHAVSSGQSCRHCPCAEITNILISGNDACIYDTCCMSYAWYSYLKSSTLTILPDAPSHKIFPMWRRRYPKERHRASGPGILFLCAKDEIILFRTRNNKLAFKSLNRYEKGYSTYCQIYVSFCTYDLRYSTKSYSVALTS